MSATSRCDLCGGYHFRSDPCPMTDPARPAPEERPDGWTKQHFPQLADVPLTPPLTVEQLAGRLAVEMARRGLRLEGPRGRIIATDIEPVLAELLTGTRIGALPTEQAAARQAGAGRTPMPLDASGRSRPMGHAPSGSPFAGDSVVGEAAAASPAVAPGCAACPVREALKRLLRAPHGASSGDAVAESIAAHAQGHEALAAPAPEAPEPSFYVATCARCRKQLLPSEPRIMVSNLPGTDAGIASRGNEGTFCSWRCHDDAAQFGLPRPPEPP